ncbi:hypothetical protein [Gloeocapsopsis sp. IPPAS B-1203]|uniref:hypothetical protein n=1 Tax=Gloeocapsopsis sp. IPPAS B-1203 TaxID=2049454 RepID=UPI000C19F053|nr:hypothetical protein [Gloeocapsopsis sp. IPPAS B-1203]PIG94354.1 hypothetical protein CSQ79_03395 [Gloeocapsopsis sp. IPPAS B-1203]
MQLNKITASLLSISLVTAAFSVAPTPANARGNKIDQLLIQHGLNPTKCGPGVVAVWVDLNQQACAVPNAQYPAGTYRLTNNFQLAAISQQTSIPQPNNQATPTNNGNPTINVFNVGTPGSYPAAPTYPNTPGGYPPPTMTTPSIVFTSNPHQPVSPVISAQINASLAAKGLSLTACSANPGVVVMMDQYMACAYPTSVYPPGRYSLAF